MSIVLNKKPYTLTDLIRYFFRLGYTGFGGPVALANAMLRDLVEDKNWFTESDYKEGLALAQLAPGPMATQLAIYLGYVDYGILGATLVGIIFVIPSFIMVVLLGWIYKTYGGIAGMQAAFYGIGASVIGLIANSSYKLAGKSLGRDKFLWVIFAISAVFTMITENESVLIFLLAGLLTWLIKSPPKLSRQHSLKGLAITPFLFGEPAAGSETLVKITLFFTKAGAMVFGSGLAIVPFLYSGVVKEYQWLTVNQFLDAVAVAMITPGPVVITVGFIGYLVAGLSGASLAALGTFLPCYLFTVIPAPYFRKYGKRPAIAAFVSGITAAATGALAGAVVVLARRSITDLPTSVFALITLVILIRFKKIPEPLLILIAGLIGLIVYPLTH